MKSVIFRLGVAAAAVALIATPALAQKPDPSSSAAAAADRPTAVERTGPSSGAAASRPAEPASSVGSSAGSVSSPSAVSAATPSMGFGSSSRAAYREEAPQHRTQAGSSGGNQAVTRGSSGGSAHAGSSGTSAPKSSTPSRQAPAANHEDGSQSVPNWARPRGDHPTTGTAVQRTTPRPDGHGGYIYNPYYDPFGLYYYGSPGSPYYYGNYYGGYYGPCGFCSPYTLGYGFGLGFPWGIDASNDPYYGGGGGGGSDYSYSQGNADEDQGALRLKIKPRDAKVYVDNYFVGTVDTMDGTFQKLPLNGGRHRVAVKADGYAPEEFDVVITPGQTATYQGDLKKIK